MFPLAEEQACFSFEHHRTRKRGRFNGMSVSGFLASLKECTVHGFYTTLSALGCAATVAVSIAQARSFRMDVLLVPSVHSPCSAAYSSRR